MCQQPRLVSAAKKATTPPHRVLSYIEMSDVAADVAAVAAFLAADTTDVLAADTTDVFSAAKAADGGSCPAITYRGLPKAGSLA